jgi:hypothetical protein
MTTRARRLSSAAALLVVIVAGLVVHGMPGSAAVDIAGDALYAIAAYAFVVLLAPRLPVVAVGAIALTWCVSVELLQLTSIPLAVAAVLPPARLVLGSGFDPRDLVVYVLAVLLAGAVDAAARRIARRGRPDPA